jgi:hypothetical protein
LQKVERSQSKTKISASNSKRNIQRQRRSTIVVRFLWTQFSPAFSKTLPVSNRFGIPGCSE